MGILCNIGFHAWRTHETIKLLPIVPKYTNPRYVKYQCAKCGKKDWDFKS